MRAQTVAIEQARAEAQKTLDLATVWARMRCCSRQ
jgi:hypothetical protein